MHQCHIESRGKPTFHVLVAFSVDVDFNSEFKMDFRVVYETENMIFFGALCCCELVYCYRLQYYTIEMAWNGECFQVLGTHIYQEGYFCIQWWKTIVELKWLNGAST